MSRCGHSFCTLCITAVIEEPLIDDQDDEGPAKRCKPDQRPCPMCVSFSLLSSTLRSPLCVS